MINCRSIFCFWDFIQNLKLLFNRGSARIFWISVSKKSSTEGLRFHLCTATSIDDFLRLLKIARYQECDLFFKLIKNFFLKKNN